MNQLKRILEGLKPGEVLTRVYTPEVRLLDKGNRVFRFVASTRAIDSYKTRLMNWNTKRYMENPVVLFTHNPYLPPVARTIKLEDDGEKMRADIQFPPKGLYDFADTLYNLTEADFLRGMSVGFKHGRAQPNPEAGCIDLFDNELGELSLVGVPSNPESLAEAMRSGQIPERYRDLFVANRAAQIQNLQGVSDLELLRRQVADWNQGRAIESITVTSGDDETPPTVDELLARCEELTTLSEELQLAADELTKRAEELEAKIEEKDGMIASLLDERNALRDASPELFYLDYIRTMAAIVEYDVKTKYTKDELNELVGEVQGRCVRIGASLNKRSRDLLRSIVTTVEEILGTETATDGGAPADSKGDDPEPEFKSEDVAKISERMKALEKRFHALRAADARGLTDDQGTPVADDDDVFALVRNKVAAVVANRK